MSIKKTSSPLSSGSEALEPLGGKEKSPDGASKIDKSFEAALAQVTGEIKQAGDSAQTESPTRSAFQQIAADANLDSSEGALAAVRESAHFLVNSRLKEGLRDSAQGKKVSDELSDYIAKDPFLHRKILSVLQRLK